MLLKEQTAKLLERCENILGNELLQIRGNLRSAKNRASAVWELLVLEASSEIGEIEYEPQSDGSPDIRLSLPGYRSVWIEVAYLYPRFWKEERKSIAVTNWIYSEAHRRNIPTFKIYPRLDGRKTDAGFIRILPDLHEKRQFLNSHDLKSFFEKIEKKPDVSHRIESSKYTLSIFYSPNAEGPFRTSGGLVQEAPNTIEKHALYRVLKYKAKQHSVSGPRLICIGSDQSSALSTNFGPDTVRLQEVINKIFRNNQSLSAVIIVSIANILTVLDGIKKQAHGKIINNPFSKTPLLSEEIRQISELNFNKWKYSLPLTKWDDDNHHLQSATGSLTWRHDIMSTQIEIPTNIVVDALAGKTTLVKAFKLKEDHQLYRIFREGWVVEACSYKDGNIELGEAPKIVLELSPPFLSNVYERNKNDA